MGNREPQEYGIIEYKDPSRYILGVPCLGFPLKSQLTQDF